MHAITIDPLILLAFIVICAVVFLGLRARDNRHPKPIGRQRNSQFHKHVYGPGGNVQSDLAKLNKLSAKEREIAELASRGLSKKEMAGRKQLSENTVGSHLKSIFRKLDVHSKAELAARYRPYLEGNENSTPDTAG